HHSGGPLPLARPPGEHGHTGGEDLLRCRCVPAPEGVQGLGPGGIVGERDRPPLGDTADAALDLRGARRPQLARLHPHVQPAEEGTRDRKSTRLNSSHVSISYAVFCLKKKNITKDSTNIIAT